MVALFTHAMPRPCRSHAMPRTCRSESDFSRPRHRAAWAWHDMCELASAVHRRHWATCPHSASTGYHAEFHAGNQKYTIPLNCRTCSSDISGYQADFNEGHGTVREWHGRGMACVNYRGTTWQGNGMDTAWYV
jgi:hypothetical protein